MILAAACGSDGDSDSIGDAIDDSIRAGCASAFECRTMLPEGGTDADFIDAFGTTEAECFTKIGPSAAVRAAFEASVAAGRLAFKASDADACLAAQGNLTCPQFWGTEETPDVAACDTQLQGTVAIGGTCTVVIEGDSSFDIGDCAGDADCDDATLKCVAPQ